MKNPSSKAREVTFSVILPDSAFVSNFSMILRDNQELVAKVMEKKKAKDVYKEAVQQEGMAGLVHVGTTSRVEKIGKKNIGKTLLINH